MKKEGTGEPQNPDIALDADVRMRELYFDKVPHPGVRFRGNTGRNSVWGSRRENLPDKVQEDAVYRNVGVRLRIASEVTDSYEVVGSDVDSETNLDREGVKTNPGNLEPAADQQRPEGKEERR